MKCAICGKEIANWGNNPYPIRKDEEARCCDECNGDFVIPARIALMGRTQEQATELIDMFDTKSFEQLKVLFS